MSGNVASAAAVERGQQLAAALYGSWRQTPPPHDAPVNEWNAIVTRLLETGAGGIGWWRVRGSALRRRAASTRLHDAYRLHTLEACVREQLTAEVLGRCQAAGVDPLLAKGWAVARLYPEPGLRPSGDIDLFLHPGQYAAAVAALADFRPRQLTVDLHAGFPDLSDRAIEEVFTRSEIATCGGRQVRTLGREDQLRHLCVHLMRHGAWRPLWLVDVAVAVESILERFDWDYCLRGNRQRTQAVVCAIGLAHHVLGARIAATPIAERAETLPRWLVPAVLRQWGDRYERFTDPPMAATLSNAAAILPAVRRRWPNPVEATMSLRGPFNDFPRLPWQLADCLVRLAVFSVRLPRHWLRAS